jgi:hypothetical protein
LPALLPREDSDNLSIQNQLLIPGQAGHRTRAPDQVLPYETASRALTNDWTFREMGPLLYQESHTAGFKRLRENEQRQASAFHCVG